MGSGMSSHRPPPRFVVDPPDWLLPLLGLQVLLAYAGSVRPRATAALLATNVLIFLRPGPLHGILPKQNYVAFNAQLFLKFRDWNTFFLSPLYHGNEFHLFTNMTALLWIGAVLEESMGTAGFASMVAALLGMSQGIAVLLPKVLCLFGNDVAYYDHHSIGFSGVLFGMEAVLACLDNLTILGDRIVPPKSARILVMFALCADSFLTPALIPNTDFLGHLSGILAGFIYHWLKHSLKRGDSLTFLISRGIRSMILPVRFAQKFLRSVLCPKGHMTGRARYACSASERQHPPGIWTCSTCTHYNSLATDVCEICSTMREDCAFSRRQHRQTWCNGKLPIEEIRRRRLDRFDR